MESEQSVVIVSNSTDQVAIPDADISDVIDGVKDGLDASSIQTQNNDNHSANLKPILAISSISVHHRPTTIASLQPNNTVASNIAIKSNNCINNYGNSLLVTSKEKITATTGINNKDTGTNPQSSNNNIQQRTIQTQTTTHATTFSTITSEEEEDEGFNDDETNSNNSSYGGVASNTNSTILVVNSSGKHRERPEIDLSNNMNETINVSVCRLTNLESEDSGSIMANNNIATLPVSGCPDTTKFDTKSYVGDDYHQLKINSATTTTILVPKSSPSQQQQPKLNHNQLKILSPNCSHHHHDHHQHSLNNRHNFQKTDLMKPSPPPPPPPPPPPQSSSILDYETVTNLLSTMNRRSQMANGQPQPQPQQQPPKMLIETGTGSIRGKRNNVRDAVKNYTRKIEMINTKDSKICRNFGEEEQNKCVLYVTSLAIIRKTFTQSKGLESILDQHFIRYDLRDVYIKDEFRRELLERLNGKLIIPALFLEGKFLGSFAEIEKLNESGDLLKLLQLFRRIQHKTDDGQDHYQPNSHNLLTNGHNTATVVADLARLKIQNGTIGQKMVSTDNGHDDSIKQRNGKVQTNCMVSNGSPSSYLVIGAMKPENCLRCGNRLFVNCTRCFGSGKCIVHHFPGYSVSLKCTHCDRSGLIPCPNCNSNNNHNHSIAAEALGSINPHTKSTNK